MSTPIYFAIFEILQKYLYGAEAVLTAEMQLTLTQLSTVLALIAVLLPFIIVFVIIKAVLSR